MTNMEKVKSYFEKAKDRNELTEMIEEVKYDLETFWTILDMFVESDMCKKSFFEYCWNSDVIWEDYAETEEYVECLADFMIEELELKLEEN